MRIRNVKNKEEIIDNSRYIIKDYKEYFGKWKSLFGNNNPIFIEIGMGKGKFIKEMAKVNKEINFIGIEKNASIVAKAITDIEDNIDNLYIINANALEIDEIFNHEVNRLYLNFSDPWPKKRHNPRRLTSSIFLDKYEKIFTKDKEIFLRTDNTDLFISSIENLSLYKYTLSDITFDLHKDCDNLITTEYEDKFSNENISIYSLKAKK